MVLYKLDRAFKSKDECIKIINQLLDNGINLKTLSGDLETNNSNKLLRSIFKVLLELDNLELDFLSEKKVETLQNRKILACNLGGRPKISPLKEDLVIRLRNDGFSYRSIRTLYITHISIFYYNIMFRLVFYCYYMGTVKNIRKNYST